jgi:hypothetical protein
MTTNIPVPVADIFHKISVLGLKIDQNSLSRTCQLKLVKEAAALLKFVETSGISRHEKYAEFLNQNLYINGKIWSLEEKIRQKEADKQYDQDFISASRNIFFWRDKGFKLRQKINRAYKSALIEQKILPTYPT